MHLVLAGPAAHLLVQLDEVVLDSEVQQPLGGVLVQLVVPGSRVKFGKSDTALYLTAL